MQGKEMEYLSWHYQNLAYNRAAITQEAINEYVSRYSAAGGMRAGFEHYRAMPQWEGTWRMSQPQMTRLRPDIVLIEYSDPGAEEIHLSTNTYGLLNAGRMLLVDTNVSSLLSFVRQLFDDWVLPSALMITHRHVVGLGDALNDLKSEFKIPLLLHPIDARHRQALASGIAFENPLGHRVLREFGLRQYYFLVKQPALSCCIHPTTEACFLLAILQAAPQLTRQKPV
jgi:hypothetical protein